MKRSSLQRFQTHLPVLEAIPRWRRIQNVVELGGGVASTGCFRTKYPDLLSLVTYETDPQWVDLLVRGGPGLPAASDRYDVRHVDWMADAMNEILDGPRGDLLFVDCNPEGARNAALRDLCRHFDLVVLHDAERPEYFDARVHYSRLWVYEALTPHTALMSNVVERLGECAQYVPSRWDGVRVAA